MTNRAKTIVIIDDEPETTEMFAEMMRLIGYRVVKSYGGSPALAIIANERPDAVVLDLMMPDLSGMDVIRFMRRNPRLAAIPVIMVSAKSLPVDVKHGLEAGAAVYLTKPVSFQDLKKAVEQALEAPSPEGRR